MRLSEGKNARRSFHDMASINQILGDDLLTTTVFEMLDEKNPKLAAEVFSVAKSSLTTGKKYKLLGKYISPETDFNRIKAEYQEGKKFAKDIPDDQELLDYFHKNFATESSELVAILIINNREKEAQEIANRARAERDDVFFNANLERALQGIFPTKL